MKRSAKLKLAIVGALLLLAAAAASGSAVAQRGTAAGDTVSIELRVWQDVDDDRDIRFSARLADGSWQTLGAIPLLLDDGHSAHGVYRYGDITVTAPLQDRVPPVRVDVRVWQHVKNGRVIYISARGRGDSWATLGTIRLLLDDGVSSLLGLRYGDISINAPLPEKEVSTLAGRPGVRGYEDGRGDEALFGRFHETLGMGLAVDRDGSVIVADRENRAIRRVAPDGTVTTIAGGNGRGVRDGPAATAQFAGPTDVAVAADGTIYVADSYGHRIRKIAPDGTVTTLAGGGPIYGPPYEEGAAGSFRNGPGAQARFAFPHGIALDRNGDLYIIEDKWGIRRLSPSGTVETFAGSDPHGYRDGPRQQARFFNLLAIDIDADGNVYVIDDISFPDARTAIRMVDTQGIVSTLYISASPVRGGILAEPSGIAVASDGAIYIANTERNQVLELTQEGELRPVAGTGEQGYADGPRNAAMFSLPAAIAVADDGTLYVADEGNNVIRTIDPSAGALPAHALALAGAEQIPRLEGVRVTVFAGRPGHKLAGVPLSRDGAARSAYFYRPWGMALDAAGNVIVADSGNDAIRQIAPDGTVTTIAGGNGPGLRDGPGARAQFMDPRGVAVHPDGSIYVADSGNNLIRKIAPDLAVTTVAGGGPPRSEEYQGGFLDGPALQARFRTPRRSPSTRRGTCSLPTAATAGSGSSPPTARSRPSQEPRPPPCLTRVSRTSEAATARDTSRSSTCPAESPSPAMAPSSSPNRSTTPFG